MNSPTFILQTVNNELAVVGSNGTQYPLSVLDSVRLTSDNSQIGIRFYDEKWDCWSFYIKEICEGLDVTKFVEQYIQNIKLQLTFL